LPYGQDFLDTLNDILIDSGQISRNIKHNCSLCFNPDNPLTQDIDWKQARLFKGGTNESFPLGSFTSQPGMTKICKACKEAKLIGL
jgi:hypothetical protein